MRSVVRNRNGTQTVTVSHNQNQRNVGECGVRNNRNRHRGVTGNQQMGTTNQIQQTTVGNQLGYNVGWGIIINVGMYCIRQLVGVGSLPSRTPRAAGSGESKGCRALNWGVTNRSYGVPATTSNQRRTACSAPGSACEPELKATVYAVTGR